MGHSLEVRDGDRLVFASDGRWLHPLLELAERLALGDLEPGRLAVRDRVVGRAAAMVLVHLGIRQVHAGVLSVPGREAFERHGVRWSCDSEVARIACATENLLLEESDPGEAWRLVAARAGSV